MPSLVPSLIMPTFTGVPVAGFIGPRGSVVADDDADEDDPPEPLLALLLPPLPALVLSPLLLHADTAKSAAIAVAAPTIRRTLRCCILVPPSVMLRECCDRVNRT
jgi:hypothetical protein